MRKNLHKILFVGTIVVLTLLLVQTFTGVVHVKSLAGVTDEAEKPKLTLQNYVDGTFQDNLEKYCREHCGFREWFIRLYNQYRWSCFRETDNTTVVRGKGNWLFEDVYVKDHFESLMYNYTNDTAVMRSLCETEALRLWKVQQLLEELGIHIFVNITPGKDVIFPEFLAENSLYTRPEGFRAYNYYVKRFDELGICDEPYLHMAPKPGPTAGIPSNQSLTLLLPPNSRNSLEARWDRGCRGNRSPRS